MGRKCIVSGCGVTGVTGSKGFFTFPKIVEIQKQWLKNILLDPNNFEIKQHHRLCSKHFNLADIITSVGKKCVRQSLKPGYLPIAPGDQQQEAPKVVYFKPWTPKFYFSVVHNGKTHLHSVRI
jgi:hypothetical protein